MNSNPNSVGMPVKTSIRNALTGLWILLLAICVGLAFFLVQLFEQSGNTQLKRTQSLVQQAGEAIGKRYTNYLANSDFRLNGTKNDEQVRELNLLLTLVLTQYDGIEGGFWTEKDGFYAYAFPTYGGPQVKKDLPSSELKVIAQANQEALRSDAPRCKSLPRERRSLVLYAAPIKTSSGTIVLWTMGWASIKNSELAMQVVTALAVLFVCSLVSGIWLYVFLHQWSSRVSNLEKVIASATTVEQLPLLSMTGQKELDQVVTAINQLNGKLKESQAASARLATELARADRLSALGRMVGGFAHEIRNPLATIHLSVENALEYSTGNQERLLKNVLQESQSLQNLVEKFLSLAKIHSLKASEVNLESWLKERMESCQLLAQEKDITLTVNAPAKTWSFDQESLSRAIYNLLLNAIQNTPSHGSISLSASTTDNTCTFAVEDSGSGVAEEHEEMIFEPLFTSRADGTGLGLTIVREIAQAHGGEIRCLKGKVGARFELEIPWLKS